jgi:hypothetical protein
MKPCSVNLLQQSQRFMLYINKEHFTELAKKEKKETKLLPGHEKNNMEHRNHLNFYRCLPLTNLALLPFTTLWRLGTPLPVKRSRI